MTPPSKRDPLVQSGWPRLRARLFHFYFLLRRPMTLGVRALVVNEQEKTVFLIRHTYVPGWQLPGGGVESGETMEHALRRELHEEGNIECISHPRLVSFHYNSSASRRDHVGVYLVADYRQIFPKLPDREIAEAGFFPIDRLPEGTTPGTLRRIAEHIGATPASLHW